jgi:hypothetical protein
VEKGELNKSAYLLVGDVFLIKQTIINIANKLGVDKINIAEFNDESFDARAITNACNQFSFFSEKRIVVVYEPIKELNLCRGTILDVLTELRNRYGQDSPYMASMAQTMVYLQDLGYKEPLSYELHTPMVINKNKFLSIFSLKYIDTIKPGQQRSLYGNLFLKDSQKIKDVKIYKGYITEPGSDKFLSTDDNSWPLVKPMIEKMFPTKSEYEI